MPTSPFSVLLDEWEQHAAKQAGKVKREISIYDTDLVKIEALAEVYNQSAEEITASLIHRALLVLEEKMPYVAGPKVIRVEEGAEIYEDVGPMVKYLEAQKALRG